MTENEQRSAPVWIYRPVALYVVLKGTWKAFRYSIGEIFR